MLGKLYIVATPIGNLEDITFRAVSVLKNVSFVLCEDTRTTKKLCDRYEIKTQLISYRDQNHTRIFDKIVEKLNLGLDLALVSDAGTPLISDPGYKLVRELKELKFEIIPIPGLDAVTAGLSVSGLPTDRYLFLGFLPKSDIKRKEILQKYIDCHATICIYESPKRLNNLLKELFEIYGDRMVSICNDLTKMYELILTDKLSNLLKSIFSEKSKGEFVVLISKD